MSKLRLKLYLFCTVSALIKDAEGYLLIPTLRSRRTLLTLQSSPTPIDPLGWPDKFPAKERCSKCGLCETTFVSQVKDACAFLERGMSRMDELEVKVHGRSRNVNDMVWSNNDNAPTSDIAEEARFGVLQEPIKLARGINMSGAQWTGVVTSIALSMLESNQVDAVVCIAAANDENWNQPEPIIARTKQDVLRGRGVKPALAPSLRVLDEIQQDDSIRRLLFCGVGCSVQAFRAVQDQLNLEKVFVLGTNCVDNSPSPEAANAFIREGVQVSTGGRIRGYEFMQDFRVHVKTENDYITKPYFSLPGSIAEKAIAKSCLACFDYTNGLADCVVGYMGAPLESKARMDESFQTLTVRNERGATMVQTAIDMNRLEIGEIATGHGSHEKLAAATVLSDNIVQGIVGGDLKESGMPIWLGEIMAFVFRKIGPTGVNFARYSIDYHLIRNYLHILDEYGQERAQNSLPKYAADMVAHYMKNDQSLEQIRSKILEQRQ